jgi:hypothetical protein
MWYWTIANTQEDLGSGLQQLETKWFLFVTEILLQRLGNSLQTA